MSGPSEWRGYGGMGRVKSTVPAYMAHERRRYQKQSARPCQCAIISPAGARRNENGISGESGFSSPPSKGSAEYFTGAVRIDPLFQAPNPARVVGASVTLRARRANRLAYASPRSETLIVTAGCGWAQTGDGRQPVTRKYRPGDVSLVSDLARGIGTGAAAHHGDDALRNSGSVERQNRRVDGKGRRRKLSA